jgi:exonuclease V gamma subunit
VLITLDKGAAKAEELPVPEDALAQLREILAVWRLGQHRWMPWFQRASEEMAQSAGDGKERERGLLQSKDWFQGREYLLEDAWVQLVLDGTDPLCHPILATQVLDLACGLGALLPPKKASGKRGAA